MKILMLAKIDSPHTKKWALALKKEGIKVALFSIHRPNNSDDWYKQLDFFYFPDREIASAGLLAKFFYISLFYNLKKIIKQFNPDILHSHFATHYSFLGNVSGFKNHMVTVWGSDVFVFPKKRKLNELIFKFNLKKATTIISTSEAMAKEVALYSNKEVHLIPFGIDVDLFYPRLNANQKNEIIIGNTKSLEPIYGIDTLIKVFEKVKNKIPAMNLKLVIVGKGSKLKEYQTLVSDLKLTENVLFKGNILPEEVPSMLNTFDFFVCLSRNESFGVSVVEAMACKVPVVVTKTPGFLEVVDSENNGVFVEIDNVNDTADKIVQLILDENLVEKNVNNAFHRVRSLYNLNDNIKKQIELYNLVLK
jgi:glycosyltransferase involved in cell wall biosynthesis